MTATRAGPARRYRLLSGAALAAACARVAGPEAAPADPARCEPIDPTLQAIRDQVFARRCAFSSCHDTIAREGVLALVETADPDGAGPEQPAAVPWDEAAEDLLLDNLLGEDRAGRAATNPHAGGAPRVAPGDCQASFLMKKLEGRELAGPPGANCIMPLDCDATAPILDACELAAVCGWIESLGPQCLPARGPPAPAVACAADPPDLLDDALAAAGLDRCTVARRPGEIVAAGGAAGGTPPAAVARAHADPLAAPAIARELGERLRASLSAAAPVASAIHAAASAMVAMPEVCAPDGDVALAEALAALYRARGEEPPADLAARAAAIDADLGAAIAPALLAAAEAAAARDAALGGLDASALPGTHDAWMAAAADPPPGFDLAALAAAAARVAWAVESARLSRFAGRDGTGFSADLPTPLGRVVVSGPRDDLHDDGEHVLLLIDTGGDDIYRLPAGSASAAFPVGLSIDLGGDDRYAYHGVDGVPDGRLPADEDGRAKDCGDPAACDGAVSRSRAHRQGAANLGVGLLWDLGFSAEADSGHDRYVSLRQSQGYAALGVGVLYDDGGDDVYLAEAAAQGAAILGVGLLLDADRRGADVRRAWHAAQGFGGPGGLGALIDEGGDDEYRCDPGDPAAGGDPLYRSEQLPGEANASHCQGAGSGCARDGCDPVPAGGVGLLRDLSGRDRYAAGVHAQGAGFGGLGALLDDQGEDFYDARLAAVGAAAGAGAGVHLDASGPDHYGESDAPAAAGALCGAARSGGVAIHHDRGSGDRYRVPAGSLGAAASGGFALAVNAGGADSYQAASPALGAASEPVPGARTIGLFVEAGGADGYLLDGAKAARDGAAWGDASAGAVSSGVDGDGAASP